MLSNFSWQEPTFRFLIAATAGTFLEFLDYTLFAYASSIIAAKLLPQNDSALTATWAIFAVSFAFRIVGTIYFGQMGDRLGCRRALLVSTGLMALSTTAIGLIPNYSVIGMAAPSLLLVLRSLQSFAVSPEYNGPATYFKNMGFAKDCFVFTSSITVAVAGLGMMTGGYWMAKMVASFTAVDLPEWRWRLPFVVSGLLVGGAALFLRSSMPEQKPESLAESPLLAALKGQRADLLKAVLFVGFAGVLTYTQNGYLVNFLVKQRGYALSEALATLSRYTLLLSLAILASGWLADRFGTFRMMQWAAVAMALASFPIFYAINSGSPLSVHASIVVYVVLLGVFSGPLPAMLANMFTRSYRYTGGSLGYNLGMSICGGATPLFMLKVSEVSHFAPALAIFLYAVTVACLARASEGEGADVVA